jgi:phosphoglycolate phosphatase-like HAD superfamily hydrolase
MKSIFALLVLSFSLNAQAFPLRQFAAHLHQWQTHHQTPVAVLDLDETMIHSAKRKTESYGRVLIDHQNTELAIYAKETKTAYQYFSTYGERLIRSLPNQYDSTALFHLMGIQNPDFVKTVDGLMISVYLSSEFLADDTAYDGAHEFLNLIYQAHGKVFFVTSRYADTQTQATVDNLNAQGLFHADQSVAVLRNRGEDSLAFKTRVFAQIKAGLGTSESVVVVGENEPENLNAMMSAFPAATPIFVTGAVLNGSVKLNSNSHLIITQDFLQN